MAGKLELMTNPHEGCLNNPHISAQFRALEKF
jgi:hypothetical protein